MKVSQMWLDLSKMEYGVIEMHGYACHDRVEQEKNRSHRCECVHI